MRKSPLKRKAGSKETSGRKKKPSISSLKKKCWKVFSLYIRRKYADPITGHASCVTCGVSKHYKELQAGHIVPGRGNSILFDERGVFPQCYACNCCNHGAIHEYIDFMKKHYGEEKGREIIEDLRDKSRNERKSFTVEELEWLIRDYQIRTGNA